MVPLYIRNLPWWFGPSIMCFPDKFGGAKIGKTKVPDGSFARLPVRPLQISGKPVGDQALEFFDSTPCSIILSKLERGLAKSFSGGCATWPATRDRSGNGTGSLTVTATVGTRS